MAYCNQDTITDAAFVNLRRIRRLYMQGCIQETITDAAFANLHGIHTLAISGCDQETITDAAFTHLRGIKKLMMGNCVQETITDAAFINLRGIHTLSMRSCDQPTITGKTLHMLGDKLKILDVAYCNEDTIEYANKVFGVTPDSYNVTKYRIFNPIFNNLSSTRKRRSCFGLGCKYNENSSNANSAIGGYRRTRRKQQKSRRNKTR